MSVGPTNIKLQELGIPVIQTDQLPPGSGAKFGHPVDVKRLIGQGIVATLLFLIIIVWFTLALNASTREQIESDYFLLQFSVYFSIIAIFIVIFIIILIT